MSEEPSRKPTDEERATQAGDDANWEELAHQSKQWPMEHEGLQAFKKNHVDRVLGERGLGHLVVGKDDQSDAKFLHERDSKTHLSPEVEHSVNYLRQQGNKIPNEPAYKIAAHINLLKDSGYINDGILTGDKESIERQIEVQVLKPNEVPESYFENMRQTYRDEGHGDIVITKEMRELAISELQTAQRFSLEEWGSYLGENSDYPDGFKTYVWNSILKLKPYDPYKETFPKRSKGTVAPYPMFNADAVKKVHELVESGDKRSFANLYTEAVHSLDYFDPELLKTVEGVWRKFDKSDNPEDAKELSSTLNEKTGWCVAGESMAGHYLKSGDFWVYYTMGKDGEFTTPRAAIATTGKRIREIRGILPGQVLEPQMIDVAYSKAAELPGGEKYLVTREDMKWVTKIFNLVDKDPNAELSSKDLRFLYEFDRPIGKVDSDRDPRIDEIRQRRDWAGDMMTIHGVKNHKELFETVLSEYDRTRALPLLLKEKKRHHIYGYSLNREERENKRQKELGSWQYETMIKNLPYLSLDMQAADELIARYDWNLPRIIDNAESFGFADTPECVATLVDKGHGIRLLGMIGYEDNDSSMKNYGSMIAQALLDKGMEKDIIQNPHVRDASIRIAAIEKVITGTTTEQALPDGKYKAEVKTALVEMLERIKNGERSQRIILPTLDDVTQFEQALPEYLKALNIRSEIFTPNKQRDMDIGLKSYRPNRHGDGTAKHFWGDVVIIDRSDLRAGDLLFRNMSRENPDNIIISVATKPYGIDKLLQSIDNLPLLTRSETDSLEPEKAAALYNELLEKEGMPEELNENLRT